MPSTSPSPALSFCRLTGTKSTSSSRLPYWQGLRCLSSLFMRLTQSSSTLTEMSRSSRRLSLRQIISTPLARSLSALRLMLSSALLALHPARCKSIWSSMALLLLVETLTRHYPLSRQSRLLRRSFMMQPAPCRLSRLSLASRTGQPTRPLLRSLSGRQCQPQQRRESSRLARLLSIRSCAPRRPAITHGLPTSTFCQPSRPQPLPARLHPLGAAAGLQ